MPTPINPRRRGVRLLRLAWLLPLGALSVAQPLAADTIINTGFASSGPSVEAFQYIDQGWTQTQTYEDVSISVYLYSWTPGAAFDITAYLTDSLGPSAISPPIATVSFTAETPDATAQGFSLFSGLTLGPGTYYLTLSSTDSLGQQPGAIWPTECSSSACPISLDAGINLLDQKFANDVFGSQNPVYPPASTFVDSNSPVGLYVTAEPIDPPGAAPEPSTLDAMLLMTTGLLVVVRYRKRARTRIVDTKATLAGRAEMWSVGATNDGSGRKSRQDFA